MTNIGMFVYILPAMFISLLLCLLAPFLGRTLGIMDCPKAKLHSLHVQSTPLVGGITTMAPWILLTELDGILADPYILHGPASPVPVWFSAFVVICLLIGALDDRLHLSPKLRLLTMAPLFLSFFWVYPDFAIAALISPAFGISVPLGIFAVPFTALCLLAFINAVNMSDGRNGLVVGVSFIWCLTLSFHVPPEFQVMLYLVMASLAVTGLFNMNGRLFLGDGGSYALSGMIGLIALYAHGDRVGGEGISSTQMAALFAIPGLDMMRLIVSRIMRGRSPMSSDHDHLHHRLERRMSWRHGLLVYLSMVGVSALVAFSHPDMGTAGLIVGIVLYGIAWSMTRKAQQTHFYSDAASISAVVQSISPKAEA